MQKGPGKIGGIVVTLAILFLLSRKASAKVNRSIFAPRQLSAHFNLSEFLVGHPDMPKLGVTPGELFNLTELCTKLLEPVRTLAGPVRITNGLRPEDVKFATSQGPKTLDEILIAKGYHPSATSHHHDGSGADFELPGKPEFLESAAMLLKSLPDTRQVILYFKTVNGALVPNHVHVSVCAGRPKAKAPNYAFVMVDDKPFRQL